MTAIAIVPVNGALVISSDGAVSDDEEKLVAEASKVVLLPEISCVIAQRGAVGFGQFLRSRLVPQSFDELMADITKIGFVRRCHDDFCLYRGGDLSWSVCLCGWSSGDERFSSYLLRSSKHETKHPDGKIVTIEPFTPQLRTGIITAPLPPVELQNEFGIDLQQPIRTLDQAINLGARIIFAARASSTSIGSYVQSTVLKRDLIISRILHRWGDPIGERIDPSRGDRLPPLFLQISQQPEVQRRRACELH